jgi:hypothetical protein
MLTVPRAGSGKRAQATALLFSPRWIACSLVALLGGLGGCSSFSYQRPTTQEPAAQSFRVIHRSVDQVWRRQLISCPASFS